VPEQGPSASAPRSWSNEGADINEPRINERIRVPEVRLVGPDGEQIGIVRIEAALKLAQEADLDLVEVAATSKPPVCKLMDYGKYKYETAIKEREARRHQANAVVKEIRFRLKIDDHDYETKKAYVVRFLKAGDKVKLTIMFRGREQSRPEAGRRLLLKLAEELSDISTVEHAPVQDGRNMSLTVAPMRKKAEVRDEARREHEAKLAAEEAKRAARKATKPKVSAETPADASGA
jgi:translation initiation factor IF-3